MFYLILGLIVISAISKAIMDTIVQHFDVSIFSKGKLRNWADPVLSWKNKWKNPEDKILKEKFPGSSTIFVFTTDLWHLSQFLFLNCLFIIPFIYTPFLGVIWDFLIVRALFGIVFEIFHRYVFKSRV